jgi:predicted anti-sigma-YlaC factor YlaD
VSNIKEMKKVASDNKRACVFVQNHLIFVAEKEIEGATPLEIQNHLDSCPGCALLVQRFARAWKDMALQEETRPTPSFFPELIKRIEAYEELSPGRKGILAAAWRILGPVAAAAVFLGGIFAGNEMGKTEKVPAALEESFTGRFLDSIDSIPKGSVADFYVSHQNLEKEDLE